MSNTQNNPKKPFTATITFDEAALKTIIEGLYELPAKKSKGLIEQIEKIFSQPQTETKEDTTDN